MKFLLLTLIVLVIFSCKPKVDEALTASSLIGTWNKKTACIYVATGSYAKTKFVFTETAFEQTISGYSDSACSVPTFTNFGAGNYVTSNLTSDLFDDRMDLNLTWMSMQVIPNSSAVVAAYNTAVLCGYSDWQLNIAKSIMGRVCGTTTIPNSGIVEYSFYTISKVSSTGPITPADVGDLNFGTSSSGRDGTSVDQRYTTKLVSPYIRQ